MSQTTSVSNYIFQQAEPIFTIQKTDSIIVKGGRLVAGSLINSAIIVAALFETIVCATLSVVVFPAIFVSKAAGLPKYFKDHTLAAVRATSQSAKAIFGHSASEEVNGLSKDRISGDKDPSLIQKIQAKAQDLFKSASKINPYYIIVPTAVICTMLLGYGIYQYSYSLPLNPVDILPPATNSSAILPTVETAAKVVDCTDMQVVTKMMSNRTLKILETKPHSILTFYDEFCNSVCSLFSPKDCSFDYVQFHTKITLMDNCEFADQTLKCSFPAGMDIWKRLGGNLFSFQMKV